MKFHDHPHLLNSPIHLGHYFLTDILSIAIDFKLEKGHHIPNKDNLSMWFSFLFALIESASFTLGIQRREISGTIMYHNFQYKMVIFDTVPEGAGHMASICRKDNFLNILNFAQKLVN